MRSSATLASNRSGIQLQILSSQVFRPGLLQVGGIEIAQQIFQMLSGHLTGLLTVGRYLCRATIYKASYSSSFPIRLDSRAEMF